MQTGYTSLYQLFALTDTPINTETFHLIIVLTTQNLVCQLLGQIHLEGFGNYSQLTLLTQRLDAWDDRDGYSCSFGPFYKAEILAVVVKQLRHGIS